MQSSEHNPNTPASLDRSSLISDKKTIEQAMELVGCENFYQKRSLIFIWTMFLFISQYFFMIPATTYPPEFQCADGSNCSGTDGECAPGTQVVSNEMSSAATEFKLYCEKSELRTLLQSIGMIGAAVGLLVINQFSDNFSRKKSILISWYIGSAASLTYCLTHSTVVLIISQFAIGLGINCLLVLLIVYINDLCSLRQRVLGITVAYAMSSFGQILIYPIIAITENWRHQILYFFAIPCSVMCLLSHFFIDDQPRFLILQDKNACIRSLKKIAKINNKPFQLSTESLVQSENELSGSQSESVKASQQQKRKYTYFDLFLYRSQRAIVIPLTLALFFLSGLYYGSQLSLDSVGYSFQLNSLIIGIAELCGYYLSDMVCRGRKRRVGGIVTLVITSVFLFLDAIFAVPSDCSNSDCYQKPLQMMFTSLARFTVSFSFSFILIQIGEAFPLSIGAIGYGFVTGLSTAGSALSPYLGQFALSLGVNPLYFLSIIGGLAAISLLMAPETLNQTQKLEIPELQPKTAQVKNSSQSSFDSEIEQQITEKKVNTYQITQQGDNLPSINQNGHSIVSA